MNKLLIVLLVLVVSLVGFGYANAQGQPNLGGPVNVSPKITYKVNVGNPPYGKFVTVAKTLENPYLKVMFDLTGNPEKIIFRILQNGKETVVMGCTPELIGNSPPRGKGLTFSIQGIAFCTFCPQSGVAAKETCNDPSEKFARSYLTLSGTATINNGADKAVTKVVVKGTMGGGGFQYTPAGGNSPYDAILAGNFNGTLKQVDN
jgi:hypothetical protein